MTTTLEITISDNSERDLLLSLFKKFRSVKVQKRTEATVESSVEGTLDFEKFDNETQRRIQSYFDAKRRGDSISLISLDQILQDA